MSNSNKNFLKIFIISSALIVIYFLSYTVFAGLIHDNFGLNIKSTISFFKDNYFSGHLIPALWMLSALWTIIPIPKSNHTTSIVRAVLIILLSYFTGRIVVGTILFLLALAGLSIILTVGSLFGYQMSTGGGW